MNRDRPAFLLHVGDLFWFPCSDEHYVEAREAIDRVAVPVVYTPGDNEWSDCHEEIPGRFDPLGRLAEVRRVFFPSPGRPLGGGSLDLVSQATEDPPYGEFVENVRWRAGGFVFATLHVVGSRNAGERFPGRTPAHDAEVRRRTTAAVRWMDAAFREAAATRAGGVALVFHAEVGLNPLDGERDGYEAFLAALERNLDAFGGTVLLIHGDAHDFRFDHPLADADGRPRVRVTRIETPGSPRIGWVRVVVDTVRGTVVAAEPRIMRGWW